MNRISTILVICFFCLIGSAKADTDLFEEGNTFYKNKEFDKAIGIYQQILEQKIESAPLYFNLGNAYFKNGDLGNAILYLMKAKRLAPDDPDIQHNLKFAGRFSSVQMEGVELNPVTAFMASLVDNYRLTVLAWLASLFFILFMVSLILRYGAGFNTAAIRLFVILSLLFLVISGGLTSFKYRYDYLTRRAVITADVSTVYTGASDKSDIELEGAPGLVVEILSESSEYYNVLFENKRRGWIKKELVAEI